MATVSNVNPSAHPRNMPPVTPAQAGVQKPDDP